jgi:hypothetical protein
VKSPIAPHQRDRRLVFGLFLAATFGMMIVLSLPLTRFIPLPPSVPGLLGFPPFLDPLRPLLPPAGAIRPPEAVIYRVAAPFLPSGIVGSGPEAVPGTVSRTKDRPRVAACRTDDASGRGHDEDGRPRKDPNGRKRAGAGPARRCERTSLRDGPRRTEGPAWTIPQRHLHGGPTVTKHGQKHWGNGHHKPKKIHKPRKR